MLQERGSVEIWSSRAKGAWEERVGVAGEESVGGEGGVAGEGSVEGNLAGVEGGALWRFRTSWIDPPLGRGDGVRCVRDGSTGSKLSAQTINFVLVARWQEQNNLGSCEKQDVN